MFASRKLKTGDRRLTIVGYIQVLPDRHPISVHTSPVQLLPTIEEPQLTIANFWRAAAPEEMEAMIVEPQESVLRNTPGVTDICSTISRGAGFVTLTFAVDTDIDSAKLDVINNLSQAPPRPADAEEPRVFAAGGGRIGDSQGDLVAVTGALREGDRIAIRGAENLMDGTAVRIVLSNAQTLGGLADDG